MKGRKEVGEDSERDGKKKKNLQKTLRNDLRDRRTRVAEHHDLNDIETFHHTAHDRKRHSEEKQVRKKHATLVEKKFV